MPGRWGACLAVRTSPTAFVRSPVLAGAAAPIPRTALTLAEGSEYVVVAGRGVVGEDGRQQVGAREAARLEVQAATFTLAVAAPDAGGAAEGEVVADRGALEGEGRECVLEDPAPLAVLAVAARAASAADGEVVGHGAAADGEHRPEEIGEAAAPAIAAVPAGPSRAADHGVVADGAVADGDNQAVAEGVERVEAAAPGEAALLAGASRAGDRRVVPERATADRGRPAGEVDGAAGSAVGAEEAGCRVAALVPVAADGLVVVERAGADHQHRRVHGPPAQDGAADPETRTNRAGAVVAADRLVVAERASGDGEAARVVDASATACSVEAAGAIAAAPRHVMGEPTVADAGGGETD